MKTRISRKQTFVPMKKVVKNCRRVSNVKESLYRRLLYWNTFI